jgi:alpha-glucosidase
LLQQRWLATLFFGVAAVLAATSLRAQNHAAFSPNGDLNWWKGAVIYEIYPRSFGDTNGDGIGDLNGVTEHLDYLKRLGINAIWLTPFYPSPQIDFGYDISDYRAIDPQYGTMADFDRLVTEAKKRGIGIICDMVLNHTSDEHPWFIESKSSRTNSKANWYVWENAKADGGPPNNWLSIFGHSAWQWDPARRQFYYHAFYKQQPDLNWRDTEVRKAMYDVLRFWMDRDVVGFRLDAITSLFEDRALRNEPVARPGVNAYGDPILADMYQNNLPEVHDVLKQLRETVNAYPGRILIGETYLRTAADLDAMYGKQNDELQLPMDTQLGFSNQLSAANFRRKLYDAEYELNGHMPLFVFDNHDNPRSWNRYGDGVHNLAIAKLVATLLLTPRDTALVYYGQELGMVESTPTTKAEVKDPIGILGWPKEKGRDGERTPMQWNADTDAGFSTAKKTWLPVASNYTRVNVAAEERIPDSLLNYYKRLIELRKRNAAFSDGSFALIDQTNQSVLSYLRKAKDGTTVLISLNCTAQPQTVTLKLNGRLKPLLSSYTPQSEALDSEGLALPPFGSLVAQVNR